MNRLKKVHLIARQTYSIDLTFVKSKYKIALCLCGSFFVSFPFIARLIALLSRFLCHGHDQLYSLETFVFEAVNCGELYLPQNGTMIGGEKTTYPSIVHFSCDEGFILNGSTLRKCQTNGTWSGNTTKCRGAVILLVSSFTMNFCTFKSV